MVVYIRYTALLPVALHHTGASAVEASLICDSVTG
jgi:hypothetical protein